MKNSLTFLVKQLLAQNQINIDKEELSFQIESHPSYPSLHAVTGVLDHFNVPNIALDVPVTENIVRQLPATFLAQLTTERGSTFAVVKNKGLSYEVRTNVGKKTILSLAEFLNKFTGVLVAVEKDSELHSKKNLSNKASHVMAIVIGFIGLTHFVIMASSVTIVLFFCFALLGVFISYSIYKQEQGTTSFLGNAFCTNESEKKGCNAVLNSKGSRLGKNYKLSDLSLGYFLGLTVAIYLFVFLSIELSMLFIISFSAIPMTLFSIYYQHFVVKKWCLLCLSIVAVLWGQATIAILGFNMPDFLSLKSLVVISVAFLVAFTVWEYIKAVIKTKNELTISKIKHIKFKRNYDVFKSLLEKSKPMDTFLDSDEIVLGNKNAPVQLIIITNPFCGFCHPVHDLMEKIYNKFPEKVGICIRFNVSTDDLDSSAVRVSRRLLELFCENNTRGISALHDIYNGQEPTAWFEKWGVSQDSTRFVKILEQESDWCEMHDFNFTPEILVNGKSFPKAYERSDLIYFIEELWEDCTEKESELRVIS